MTTPATNRITATFSIPEYAPLNNPFTRGARFDAAFVILSAGLVEGKIWNVEFQDAKSVIADGCEHAQHVAAHNAREWQADGGAKFFTSGDARNEIGYAFGMNQAAKLSRRLKKLGWSETTPGIATYIETLDQIAAINVYLKQFKAIIVKGRRPQVKTEEQLAEELANLGTCAICGHMQKLDDVQGMVHHGYKMSDYNHAGYRIGFCFGVKFLPYEFSCEANKQFIARVLQPELKGLRKYLADLNASAPVTLDVTTHKWENHKQVAVITTHARGTREYEQQRGFEISHTEFEISHTEAVLAYQTELIKVWKLKPLQDGTTKK